MIPAEEELANMVRVEFPYPNKIPYMLDHGFYKGVPAGSWWIDDFHGQWTSLVRPGYGTKGKYGSGGISVATTSLSLAATEREEKERRSKEDRVLAEAQSIADRRGIAFPRQEHEDAAR